MQHFSSIVSGEKLNVLTLNKKTEDTFTEKGYNNWKKVIRFGEHDKNGLHNKAR